MGKFYLAPTRGATTFCEVSYGKCSGTPGGCQVTYQVILTHLDNSTASDSTFENGSQCLGQFRERSLVSNQIEQAFGLVIAGQMFPDLAAHLHRAVDRLDTQQVNGA